MVTPCPSLPADSRTFARVAESAHATGMGLLLQRHLLSCLSLDGWRKCEPVLANLLAMHAEHGCEIPAAKLLDALWTTLPILTRRGQSTETAWFLLGFVPGESSLQVLFPPIPEPGSIQAIDSARRAVEMHCPDRAGSYFFSSMAAGCDDRIQGASLGLVFGLGMCLLAEGKTWPQDCHATGELTCTGEILPVDFVGEKFVHIRKRTRIFLRPDSGLSPRLGEKDVPCRTLTDALFAIHLAMGGVPSHQYELLRACAHDAHTLLANFEKLPVPFFRQPVVKDLLQSLPAETAQHLPAMAKALAVGAAQSLPAADVLAVLLPPAAVAQIIADHPDLEFPAFEWCVSSMCLANHRGDIQQARQWQNLADQLRQQVSVEEHLDLLNHRFVRDRFNRYDFRPELPPDLAQLLENEERVQRNSPRPSRILGALYGTIAQNYGFCGPAWLNLLHEYVERARNAFGGKYRSENLRLHTYVIHGLLDAGLIAEARKRLNVYLDLPEPSGSAMVAAKIRDLLNDNPDSHAYQASVASRVLAELEGNQIKDIGPGNLNGIAGKAKLKNRHPWQLTSLNLGRLYRKLGDQDSALDLLQRAVAICSGSEATIRVMALLPLAELHVMDAAQESEYQRTIEIVRALRNSPGLNRNHFQYLMNEPDPREVLNIVYSEKQKLFPFSYR